MILRGRIRGNGAQLATYLLTKGDNQSVQVFDIRGTSQPNDLKKSLVEMSLTSELSGRTEKGLYHVVINPRPGEDRKMTAADWFRAAEILEEQRGFTGQKRIMVLHEKKGRLHMHVAWERYNHDQGKMICNKQSRRDQDRARKIMEIEFAHLRTPDRNLERPELRKLLSRLWQQHQDGKDFIAALGRDGYTVAKSADRRPYVIINQVGTSFDLDREIREAKVADLRSRFKGIHLPDKKTAIARIRELQSVKQPDKAKDDREQKIKELKQQLQRDQDKNKSRGR